MKNVVMMLIVFAGVFSGCSAQNGEYIKYNNFGTVESIKCSDNNMCMVETNKTVTIVKSDDLPSSPSENDTFYKITYTSPYKIRDMWCLNKSCKPVDTCVSVNGKCT